MNKTCGIIIPVFNEENSILELADRINIVFKEDLSWYNCEIIFINDGSTDGTLLSIKSAQLKYKNIKAISFRSNLGKSLALMAGFRQCEADIVVTMDGDLQDNPEDIPKFLRLIESGHDLVNGLREVRHDSMVRRIGSRIYNKTVQKITGCFLNDLNCGFKAYKSIVYKSIIVYGDYHRYIPLMSHFMGFKISEVLISNSKRRFGKSKYMAFRYQGFFDLLSIIFLYKYRFKPMHFFGTIGSIFFLPSLAIMLWFGFSELFFELGFGSQFRVLTRPIIIYSIGFMLSGLVIMMVGVICDFILYLDVKNKVQSIIELYTTD